VRQLWVVLPSGKLPFSAALVRGREASRLAWCTGIPILLTFGGISRDERRALKILLWLIAVTLNGKPKNGGEQSVWLFPKMYVAV